MQTSSRIAPGFWRRWTRPAPESQPPVAARPDSATRLRLHGQTPDDEGLSDEIGNWPVPPVFERRPLEPATDLPGEEAAPLLQALARDEFELHYQAQFECRERRLIGAEALLRWRDPRQGLRLPGEFMGAAERSGAIRHLDAWALRAACRQMRQWQDLGIAPPLIAVNVSAPQFARPDLVDFVAEVLRETGLDPACLELEIVERALLDPVRAAPTMRRLRAMGVRLAIDDFGTGYSSLGYLTRYPVNRLKIDRCFVARMGRDRTCVAITDAVVALGLTLGLDVVAEGVETEDQLEHLKLHHCPAAQGWLFGQPQDATTFAQTLRRELARR